MSQGLGGSFRRAMLVLAATMLVASAVISPSSPGAVLMRRAERHDASDISASADVSDRQPSEDSGDDAGDDDDAGEEAAEGLIEAGTEVSTKHSDDSGGEEDDDDAKMLAQTLKWRPSSPPGTDDDSGGDDDDDDDDDEDEDDDESADESPAEIAQKAHPDFGFMLRSVLKSSCLRLDGQSFQLATCNRNDPQQQFTALGNTIGVQGKTASNVTMYNGKVLCFTGSDKIEAYDESCVPDFAAIEMSKAKGGCFTLKWKKTNCQPGGGCVQQDTCMAPPNNDQDMLASANYCSEAANDGLWVNFAEDPTKTSCD